MRPVLVYRTRFSRIFALVVWAVCAVALISLLIAQEISLGAVLWAGLVAALAWAALWVPACEVSDGGIQFDGVFTQVHMPWPAFTEAASRGSLRISDSQRSFNAFAMPAASQTRASIRHSLTGKSKESGTRAPREEALVDPGPDGSAARQNQYGTAEDAVEAIERRHHSLRIEGFLGNPDPQASATRTIAVPRVVLVGGLLIAAVAVSVL